MFVYLLADLGLFSLYNAQHRETKQGLSSLPLTACQGQLASLLVLTRYLISHQSFSYTCSC
jgi:hypothetical protein